MADANSIQFFLDDTTDYSDFMNGKVTFALGDYNVSSNFTITYKNVNGKYTNIFDISAEMDFYVYGSKVLVGIIEDIKFKGKSGKETITISGRDYTATLQDITIPPETYTSEDVSDIIDDFMTKYSPDVTYVQATYGETIDRISFNHVSIFDALKKLAEKVGAKFYVNTSKVLIFEQAATTSSGLTFNNTNIFKAQWDTTRKEIVNQCWVYGSRVLSGYSETFIGDGVGSVFGLAYKPESLNVQVSGAQQIGGVFNMTSRPSSGINYLVDYDDKQVIFVSGADIAYDSTPGSLVTISTSYDRSLKIAKRSRNISSINNYKLREKIIQDNNIKDPNEAASIASSELKPEPFTKGTLYYDGTTILTPGQTCIVNFPNDRINEVTYDMLEVTYNLSPTNIQNNNFIKIVVNKRISDINDTIKGLIQDVKDLQANEIGDVEVMTRLELGAGSVSHRILNWTVQERGIAGETGIYGNASYGIYGTSKYGDSTSVSFILGNAQAGVLGTNSIGSSVSSWTARVSGGTW